MRFIHHDHAISFKIGIVVGFLQQQTVGHDLDARNIARAVVKANGKANFASTFDILLLRDTPSHADRSDSARLRDADEFVSQPRAQQHLRNLGGLPAAGRPLNNNDLVLPDRG